MSGTRPWYNGSFNFAELRDTTQEENDQEAVPFAKLRSTHLKWPPRDTPSATEARMEKEKTVSSASPLYMSPSSAFSSKSSPFNASSANTSASSSRTNPFAVSPFSPSPWLRSPSSQKPKGKKRIFEDAFPAPTPEEPIQRAPSPEEFSWVPTKEIMVTFRNIDWNPPPRTLYRTALRLLEFPPEEPRDPKIFMKLRKAGTILERLGLVESPRETLQQQNESPPKMHTLTRLHLQHKGDLPKNIEHGPDSLPPNKFVLRLTGDRVVVNEQYFRNYWGQFCNVDLRRTQPFEVNLEEENPEAQGMDFYFNCSEQARICYSAVKANKSMMNYFCISCMYNVGMEWVE